MLIIVIDGVKDDYDELDINNNCICDEGFLNLFYVLDVVVVSNDFCLFYGILSGGNIMLDILNVSGGIVMYEVVY